MAEFAKVMNELYRMCDFYEDNCLDCPLFRKAGLCYKNIVNSPKIGEEIIMQWAKENPPKTNADKFKEVFGNIALIRECSFIGCDDGTGDCFKDFWNREYIEPR